jgi:hypothetical protein
VSCHVGPGQAGPTCVWPDCQASFPVEHRFERRSLSNSPGSHANIYLVDVIFDDRVRRTVEVAECNFGHQKIDLLLGRDFLAAVEFRFFGPEGRYILSFE